MSNDVTHRWSPIAHGATGRGKRILHPAHHGHILPCGCIAEPCNRNDCYIGAEVINQRCVDAERLDRAALWGFEECHRILGVGRSDRTFIGGTNQISSPNADQDDEGKNEGYRFSLHTSPWSLRLNLRLQVRTIQRLGCAPASLWMQASTPHFVLAFASLGSSAAVASVASSVMAAIRSSSAFFRFGSSFNRILFSISLQPVYTFP